MEKTKNNGWPVFGPGRRNNGTVRSAGSQSRTHDKDAKTFGSKGRGPTRRFPSGPPPRVPSRRP